MIFPGSYYRIKTAEARQRAIQAEMTNILINCLVNGSNLGPVMAKHLQALSNESAKLADVIASCG